ncbi:MAG: AMP-binding protein [Lautropia sp.]
MSEFGGADPRHTIARALIAQAERHGDKPLLKSIADGSSLGYAQLAAHAEAGSARLHERGLTAGRVAAVYLSANLDIVRSVFACLFGGVVNVGVNPDFRKTSLRFALQAVTADAVFTDAAGLENLLDEEVLPALARLKLVVLAGSGESGLAPDRARHLLRASACGLVSLDELLEPGPTPRLWESVDAAAPAVVRFTSGTTGRPKGIVQTHLHVLNKCFEHNLLVEYGSQDILYSPFPLYHGLASVMGLMGTLSAGGTMVTAPRFSASRYWQDAAESGATLGHLLSSLVPFVEAQAPGRFDRGHRVRWLYTGVPNPGFEARFGARFVQSYSNGEIGIISAKRGGLSPRPSGSGMPLPYMDVRIVDELDRPVPHGEPGEIVVRPGRPHQIMLCYANDLPATMRAMRSLWYHTGDEGHFDEAGELHFTGRLGDTIRRRGVNISSQQIESEIRLHTPVLDCAVIAVPSATGEQELHACIVWKSPHDADADAAMKALQAFLAARLPKSYVPRYFEQLDALPMTPTGKVQKAQLRAARRHGPTWEWERGAWTRLTAPQD